MDLACLGRNKRESLNRINKNFDKLFEEKQNKIHYSDSEPANSENGDIWIDTSIDK